MESFNLGGVYLTAGLAQSFRADLQRQVGEAVRSVKIELPVSASTNASVSSRLPREALEQRRLLQQFEREAIQNAKAAASEQARAAKVAEQAAQAQAKALQEQARASEQAGKKALELAQYQEKVKQASISAEIRTQRDEVAKLTNTYVAVGGNARQYSEQLRKLSAEALGNARNTNNSAEAQRKWSDVAARATREADKLEGKISRLGLASQVRLGVADELSRAVPVFGQVTAAATPVGGAIAAIGAAGFAAAAGLNAASQAAGRYETALQDAEITTGANTAQLKELDGIARSVGLRLGFAPDSTAAAFAELGTQGVDVGAILEGAGKSTLVLGRAINDVGLAANIQGQALQVFGLAGKDTARVADIVANAVNTTALKAQDFNLFIGAGGAAAKAAGIDFATYTATIAAVRPAFSSAQDAGTSFKTFIASLTPNSKAASNAMREIGFTAFDSAGQLKPLATIIEELRTKLRGLSDQKRLELIEKIFGSDASRFVNTLVDSNVQVDSLAKSLSSLGAAADQADKRLSTFEASVQKRNAAFANLGVAIGERVNPVLQKFNEIATDNVTNLTKQVPEFEKFFQAIARNNQFLKPFMVFLDRVEAYQPKTLSISVEAKVTGDRRLLEAALNGTPKVLSVTTAPRPTLFPGLDNATGRTPLGNALANQAAGINRNVPAFVPPAAPVGPSKADLDKAAAQQSADILAAARRVSQAVIQAENLIADAQNGSQADLIRAQANRAAVEKRQAEFEARGQAQKDALATELRLARERNQLARSNAEEAKRQAEEAKREAERQAEEAKKRAEEQLRERQRIRTEQLRDSLESATPKQLQDRIAIERGDARNANEIIANAAKDRIKIIQDEFDRRAKIVSERQKQEEAKRVADANALNNRLAELSKNFERTIRDGVNATELQRFKDGLADITDEAKKAGIALRQGLVNQATTLVTKGQSTVDAQRRRDQAAKEAKELLAEQERLAKLLQDNLEKATNNQLTVRLALERNIAETTAGEMRKGALARIKIIEDEFKRRAELQKEKSFDTLQGTDASRFGEDGVRAVLGDAREAAAQSLIDNRNPFEIDFEELQQLEFTFQGLGLTGTTAFEKIQAAIAAYRETIGELDDKTAEFRDRNSKDLQSIAEDPIATIRKSFTDIKSALQSDFDPELVFAAFPEEFANNLSQAFIASLDLGDTGYADYGAKFGTSFGRGFGNSSLGEIQKNWEKLFLSDQTDIVPPDFTNGSAFAEIGDVQEIRQGQIAELQRQTQELTEDFALGKVSVNDYRDGLISINQSYSDLVSGGDLTSDQIRTIDQSINGTKNALAKLNEELDNYNKEQERIASLPAFEAIDGSSIVAASLDNITFDLPPGTAQDIRDGLIESVIADIGDVRQRIELGAISAEDGATQIEQLQNRLREITADAPLTVTQLEAIARALKNIQDFAQVDANFADGLDALGQEAFASAEQGRADTQKVYDEDDRRKASLESAFTTGAGIVQSAILGGLNNGALGVADAIVSAGGNLAQQIGSQIISAQATSFATKAATGGLSAGLDAINPLLLLGGVALSAVGGLISQNQTQRRAEERQSDAAQQSKTRTISTLTFNNYITLAPSFNGDYASPEARTFMRGIATEVAVQVVQQYRNLEAPR